MLKVFTQYLLPSSVLILLIFLTFRHLANSFYEQEEWLGVGNVFVYGSEYIYLIFKQGILKALIGEGRIFSSLINYFFYSNFPFNTLPITLFSLTIHIINSILVYVLLMATVRKLIPSLLGAAFFAVNAVAHSAVTWSDAISTLPASSFVILSTLVYLIGVGYTKQNSPAQTINKKLLLLSFVLLYISLLFKQIGIFLFILFPLFIYFFSNKNWKKSLMAIPKKYLIAYLFLFLTITGFYLVKYKMTVGPDALFITGTSPYFFQTLIMRAILYPLTSFSLIFVPPIQFLDFSRHITNIYYPFFPAEQFILIAQTVVLDLIAVTCSISLIVILLLLSKKASMKEKNILFFFLIFMILSFLPYVIISKTFAYLDSRYYYLAVVGASFIITWILTQASRLSRWYYIPLCLVFALFVLFHASVVSNDIDKQVKIAQERKIILSQLSQVKPTLSSDKNIFFIDGSNEFYLSGHRVPFQNGIGHTLAVWYYSSGKISDDLIRDRELFEIGKQGYYEYDGKGFGYFSDENELKKNLIQREIFDYELTALYYNANEKKLIDITSQMRDKLRQL